MTGLTDSSGAVSERHDYEPYGGREMSATGAAASSAVAQGQFGYAGGYRSVGPPGQELYHFGQRFYDPSEMRWTQADPLDQTGDLTEGNQYGYVGCDPVNYVDSAGDSRLRVLREAWKKLKSKVFGRVPWYKIPKCLNAAWDAMEMEIMYKPPQDETSVAEAVAVGLTACLRAIRKR